MLGPGEIFGQNYTGPYISNGKFQKSVAFGESVPLSATDSFSRLHDTSRVYYGPGGHRTAADSLYRERVKGLGKIPSLAGDAVLYGSAVENSLSTLANSVATGARFAGLPGAFAGLVYGGVKNLISLEDYVVNRDKYKRDVKAMEKLDPHPNLQLGFQGDVSSSPLLRRTLPTSKNSIKEDEDIVPTTVTKSAGSGTVSVTPDITTTEEIGEKPSVTPPVQWLGGGEYSTMVKKSKNKQQPKQKKKGVVVTKPKVPKQRPAAGKFGPITTISTAPVAIGNSVTGSATEVLNSGPNSITLRGRDFMFSPIGTGSVTTWTLCGGTPLSPAAFADTTLAQYMRMYAKYRFKQIVVHYITASPTSATGDVMFYYGKDRSSVFLNQTSPQLLGFVMSDPNTVIGPQWTNHSAVLKPTGEWKLTDYGMHDGIEEYADGELFLLSKTNTTSTPGYVIFDYVIEFAMHQLQPRLAEFPIPKIQWFQTRIGRNVTAVTTGYSTYNYLLEVMGNNISGTAAAPPSSCQPGDVFKIILDVTNSAVGSWTAVTVGTLFQIKTGATQHAITVTDGMTLYAVATTTAGAFGLYTTPSEAFNPVDTSAIRYGVADTITFGLQCWLSYVGSISDKSIYPNF